MLIIAQIALYFRYLSFISTHLIRPGSTARLFRSSDFRDYPSTRFELTRVKLRFSRYNWLPQ